MAETKGKKKRGGDEGETGLLDGSRAAKSDGVFAVLGDIDELSSMIGLAKAYIRGEAHDWEGEARLLESVQIELVRMGAQVAMPESDGRYDDLDVITNADVERLESAEEGYKNAVRMPREFILPGATTVGAHVDVARAVCRRAERRLVGYISEREMKRLDECRRYLNRLSGLLFALARRLEENI